MSPSIPRKRPTSSSVPHSSPHPPARKRASQACLSCRSRKVRCDVATSGMPCTNCRLDSVVCQVKETQRGRKACPARATTHAHSPGQPIDRPRQQRRRSCQEQGQEDGDEEVASRSDAEGESDVDDGSVIECQPSTTSHKQQGQSSIGPRHQTWTGEEPVEQSEVVNAEDPNLPPSPCSASLQGPQPTLLPDEARDERLPRPSMGPPRCVTGACTAYSHRNVNDRPRMVPAPGGYHETLPLYIKPIPKRMDKEDIEYMRAKRCLDIPDDELRDSLLRSYIMYVHPLIPAIEIGDVVDAIMAGDGRSQISLLLFQSIMFVAIAFVDTEILLARGYSSPRAAREDFFQRVRILYSLNFEKDRVALTQSLLPMTYWYDAPDDDKDTWYWMGIALTTATVSGFHRDPAMAAMSHQVPEARLQRRIWWCCFMRDRFLALGLRRPPRIRDDDYTVSMLSEDDFDLGAPSDAMISLFEGSKYPCPVRYAKRELAVMNIELCRLSLIVGRILYSQYTSVGAYYGGSEYLPVGTQQPKKTQVQINTLAECSIELSIWNQRQSMRVPYVPGEEPTPSRGPGNILGSAPEKENVLRFHRIQLHMLYLATLNALRRPTVFCPGAKENTPAGQPSPPTEADADPAIEMVKLAFDLQRNHHVRYLTTLAVPSFLAVALVHLLDSRHGDEQARNLSLGRLYQAVYVLQKLQSIYSSADYAISFLKSILVNAKLSVPLLSMNDWATEARQTETASKPPMDMGPNEVAAACMYPSPSASAHTHGGAGASSLFSSSEATGSMYLQDSLWQAAPACGHLPLHELVAGSPFLTSWFDSDVVPPEMAQFEVTGTNTNEDFPMTYC